MSYEYKPYESGNDAAILDVDKSVKIALSLRNRNAAAAGDPQLGIVNEYVVDGEGEALSGVTVRACDSAGNAIESGSADGEGHVELLLAPGTYDLKAEKDGYVCANESELRGIRVTAEGVTYPDSWVVMEKAGNSDSFSLVGVWETSDGDMAVEFRDDGTYAAGWSMFGLSEEGEWSTGAQSGESFPIEMSGSGILQLMQLTYGAADGDYHFEILKENAESIYLTQVYGDYTAKTSPCKLPLERR